METSKPRRMKIGWVVIGVLAVLTGIEFWLSGAVRSSLSYLVVTSFAKAALILYYFMHVSQTWRRQAGHE